MKKTLLAVLLGVAAGAGGQALSGVALGVNSDLNGWVPGTSSNPWRQNVAASATDSSNASWQAEVTSGQLAGGHLQPDASIPYTVVDNTAPLVPIVFSAQAQRWGGYDNVRVPLSTSMAVEGGLWDCPTNSGTDDLTPDGNLDYSGDPGIADRHALILNRDSGFLYELYDAYKCPHGFTVDSSVTVWDTTVDEARPQGWTSVDAAGLSVFMGLVKYDEANSGTINHALRFTMPYTACRDLGAGMESVWVLPATHASCKQPAGSPTYNVTGMRVRLKASFDETPFASYPRDLAIIHALKTFGMILADNGSTGFFQLSSDSRWDGNELALLEQIHLSSFDVTQMGSLLADSALPSGTPPSITTPTVTPATIFLGQCATLNWTSTGQSYEYVVGGAPTRTQSAQVCPTGTTTFAVQSLNAYGSTVSGAATVHVQVPLWRGVRTQGVRRPH